MSIDAGLLIAAEQRDDVCGGARSVRPRDVEGDRRPRRSDRPSACAPPRGRFAGRSRACRSSSLTLFFGSSSRVRLHVIVHLPSSMRPSAMVKVSPRSIARPTTPRRQMPDGQKSQPRGRGLALCESGRARTHDLRAGIVIEDFKPIDDGADRADQIVANPRAHSAASRGYPGAGPVEEGPEIDVPGIKRPGCTRGTEERETTANDACVEARNTAATEPPTDRCRGRRGRPMIKRSPSRDRSQPGRRLNRSENISDTPGVTVPGRRSDQAPPSPRAGKSWWRTGTVVLALLVLLVAGTELALRFILGLGDPVLIEPDSACSYVTRPNQKIFRFLVHTYINRYGMRSDEFFPTSRAASCGFSLWATPSPTGRPMWIRARFSLRLSIADCRRLFTIRSRC